MVKMVVVGGHHDGETRDINPNERFVRLYENVSEPIRSNKPFNVATTTLKYHVYAVDCLTCQGEFFHYLRSDSVSPKDSIRMLLDNYTIISIKRD